jgi:hypothetical protein
VALRTDGPAQGQEQPNFVREQMSTICDILLAHRSLAHADLQAE